jgi:hypothetical protein
LDILYTSHSLKIGALKYAELLVVSLTFDLYGCETWSLTLKEVRRLKVLENRVLREIIGPKRDMKTGEWRRLHIKELRGFYCSLNFIRMIKSRRMRWAVRVARCKK